MSTMLDRITPLILTRNEAPNIGNTLSRLEWARDIVVVDSFSTDDTIELLSRYANVRVFQRPFDTHAAQWEFGLRGTGIATPWVLALDADYQVTAELAEEMRRLEPGDDIGGYRARFRYCVEGTPLRGAAYPPVTVLYRREQAQYVQDGHTQRVSVPGRISELHAAMLHDDRKPLGEWIASQERYMRLEALKLAATPLGALGWADRLRCMRVVAPFAMLVYCLFLRGAILDGRAGLYYAFQRTFAELLLSLHLLQGDLLRRR